MTRAEWKARFREMGVEARTALFKLGDMMIEAERETGEEAATLADETGLPREQLLDIIRVATIFPPDKRQPLLPWSYHRDAGSDPDLARALLDAAVRNGWSRKGMRAALREMRARLGGA